MNQFQSTGSGQGMLKNTYDSGSGQSNLSMALHRKRKRMEASIKNKAKNLQAAREK